MPVTPVQFPLVPVPEAKDLGKGSPSFRELFWKAVQEVDELQKQAERKALEVATGEAKSFHEAVIAMEKAALALQLVAQVQSKLIEAYHEVMRIQI